jgi:hypothetical protein
MFAFIRRHQAWGFVFIALVIISFVVFFSPTSRYERYARGVRLPVIYGEQVTSEEYLAAAREAQLGFFLRYGRWPSQDSFSRQVGFDLSQETLRRLVLVKKLKKLHIEASDQAVADQIAEYLRDRNTGAFNYQDYERFVRSQLASERTGQADFERFVRHEVCREQLMAVAALAGELVTPRDAEISFRRENEQVDTQLVLFSSSNYLSKVTLDPEKLAQFYTNRQADYRVPERVQVSYVRFDATNYLAEADKALAQITNLDLSIDQFYRQQSPDAFKDEKGQTLTADAAKAKIKEAERKRRALSAAQKAANDFANALYKEPPGTNSLPRLAAALGFESNVTDPFSEDEIPAGLRVRLNFTKAAFSLSADEPFATPVVGEDAVYVFALWNRLPAYVPSLESIRARLVEDYRRYTAAELARQAGEGFAATLTNGLAQGKSFDVVCLEQNVILVKLPPFSRATRSLPELPRSVSLSELQNVAFDLASGQASAFRPTFDGGFVVQVKSRIPVDEARLKADLPGYMAQLRQERQLLAFADWFNHEVQKAGVRIIEGPVPEE